MVALFGVGYHLNTYSMMIYIHSTIYESKREGGNYIWKINNINETIHDTSIDVILVSPSYIENIDKVDIVISTACLSVDCFSSVH